MARTSHRRRRNRRLPKPIVLLLAALAVGGGGVLLFTFELPLRQPPRPAAVAPAIYLDGGFGPRFAGEMIAWKLGLFPGGADAVTLHAGPEDDAGFVEKVARQHAVGVTTGQRFLLAAWKKVPVVAVGASFLDTPEAIFTLERSGLRRPADVIGKRLGVRNGSEGELIVDAMMAELALPRSLLQKVPGKDSFEALSAGEVDAVVGRLGEQPLPADFPSLTVIRPQDYGIHVPGLVYFASADLVRDHSSLVSDILQGIIRGWRLAYADYNRSVPILVGFAPNILAPATVRFALEQQRDLVLPPGGRIAEYDESRWRTLRDILLFGRLGQEEVSLSTAVSYQLVRDTYRRSPDLSGPGGMASEN